MFQTPILFIVFNRPDITFRVFEKIRQIQPKYLFIAADGARKNMEHEQELCEQTRTIVDRIDWNCELKTLFRDQNIGCGRGVSEAITWFFDHVDSGIILEDDCLPDLSFFNYCGEMLDHYKNEKKVMHIGGTNSQFARNRSSYSYYFSKYPHIWGWATWKRAWDHFKFDLSETNIEEEMNKIITNYTFTNEEKKYWTEHFIVMKKGGLDTWDIQWTFACWANRGVTIVPNVNLISNIGFNINATHTVSEHSKLANRPTQSMHKIVHPAEIVIDVTADDATFRNYNLSQVSVYNRVKQLAISMLPQPVKTMIKKAIK